jgi:hypothetical protein
MKNHVNLNHLMTNLLLEHHNFYLGHHKKSSLLNYVMKLLQMTNLIHVMVHHNC